MSWPAVKRSFTQEMFRQYVQELEWRSWRPQKIVWHNTALPTLKQWIVSGDHDREDGMIPGSTRIANLEKYFRFDNKWSGCPHLFVANDFIWVMNPLTSPGVHSPSFNSTSIGIEMVGDYSIEDDESGEGLRVKNNTIFATAVLCTQLGLNPPTSILLHREDPRTTHDCPGVKIARDKLAMIRSVSDLMAGGEHDPSGPAIPMPLKPPTRVGTVLTDDLNLRTGPGVASEAVATLQRGFSVEVLGEARNGSTQWLHVRTGGGMTGWVAGRYVSA